jgi:hypothetical protein
VLVSASGFKVDLGVRVGLGVRGRLGARGSDRARDWEALGSCRFGAHGVWVFGIVSGLGLVMGLWVRVGLGVWGS